MKSTRKYFVWFLVYFVSIVGAWICIDPGHEFGDDFILYVDQAEQFWDPTAYQWLERENRFCMDHSDQLIGPYLYPRGFPFFLSIFIGVKAHFGWQSIKLINFLFFLSASGLFLHRIGKKFSIKPLSLLLLGIVIVWNPKIWEAADRLQSDLFFAALVMLFWWVWWQDGGNTFIRWILLGGLVFWATLTKTNGVLLLVPILWSLLLSIRGISRLNLKYRYTWLRGIFQDKEAAGNYAVGWAKWGIGLTISAGLLALWLERGTGANHWKELVEGGITHSWISNFLQYWGMLSALPVWHLVNGLKLVNSIVGLPELWVWIPFALVTIFWGIALFRGGGNGDKLTIALFIFANLILLTVWPSQQGVRMLFPLYPLWVLLVFLIGRTIQTPRWFARNRFMDNRLMSLVLVVFVFVQGTVTALHYKKLDTNRAFSTNMLELSDCVEKKLEKDAVFSFFKPRLLRYLTGKRVIRVQNTVDYTSETLKLHLPVNLKVLRESGVDYFIIPKSVRLNDASVSFSMDDAPKSMDLMALAQMPVVFQNQQFRIIDLRVQR